MTEVQYMLRWKLRTVMADRKITNKQLAQQLGLHRNTVQQLRDDRPTMIRFEYLESLCQFLQCEPSDLFEFQQEPQKISVGSGESKFMDLQYTRKTQGELT